MKHSRNTRWLPVPAVGALLLIVLSGTACAQLLKQPGPGEVYREFIAAINVGSDDWRVTDPNINLSTYPQAAPFLPNPTLNISLSDLAGATRAEAIFAMWGGHIGTHGKQVRFNGNGWIDIPEITTTPGSGECYISEPTIGVSVPLSDLHDGNNTFQGNNSGQGCYGFGWGQFGWYTIVVRIYYNPATKSHVTGNITSPTSGATFGDNPTVSVSVTGSADRVDVLAFYDGFDTDGNGDYVEYHHDYQRGIFDSPGIQNHVGTDFSSPFNIPWTNTWVPDQTGVKLLARIRGSDGVWYVTPEVTGLNLLRSTESVKLYKGSGVGEREWARGDLGSPAGTMQTFVDIPSLSGATGAMAMIRTWNGVDGDGDPDHYKRLNGYYFSNFGANHYYSYDVLDVPGGTLQTGTNTFEFKSNTTASHGIEVLWPGPAVAVRFNHPLPIQLASFSAVVVSAREVQIKWSTLSETNNFGFEVQKALNEPVNFSTIPNSFTPGHGTTLEPKSYSFMDTEVGSGVVYYRLKQIDLDGTVRLYDPLRVDLLTSVGEAAAPLTYQLDQAYPNPFNPSAKIKYALPTAGLVRVRVFNQLGQTVRELVNENQAAGYHEVTLEADGLPSGVYYYRMDSGSFVDVKKVVLLR